MILKMANPWKHPQTGVYYFRERVPARLRERLWGERFGLKVDGEPSPVTVNGFVKVSLRTKDARAARDRHRDVSKQVSVFYQTFEDEGFALTHEQAAQLAGEWYRSLVAEFRANPGDPEGWDEELWKVGEALEHFIPDDDPEYPERDRLPYNPARGEELLKERLKPDLFLQERQLRLTPKSRLDFLRAAGQAHMDACQRLGRMAHGDYGPDAAERRFPTEPFTRKPEAGSVDIWALFDAYALERKPTPKTLSGYRFSIGQFVESVGHADARRFTKADVLRWKDAMVAANVPAKTINDARLAHLKAVLNYAVNNERLPLNPASKVSAGGRGNKDARKMLAYGDHEAATILTAAVADARPVIRWVPLLCAMHGARVAEMMQLRREDLFLDGGVWSIRITEDAGRLKNKASERIIPLHPCLVQRGFLAFLSEQSKGPLFYNEARRKKDAAAKPGKGATNHLREFIHAVAEGAGLQIGREHRKDPNHACAPPLCDARAPPPFGP